ncbi:MAG: 4-alpha-glucanotransferase, partial [Chloroflexota bacterium]
ISFQPGFLGCNKNPQHNHHRAVWASVAVFALAPMQDLLNLGTEARMNYPSRLGGNWEWRMEEGALSEELKGRRPASVSAPPACSMKPPATSTVNPKP